MSLSAKMLIHQTGWPEADSACTNFSASRVDDVTSPTHPTSAHSSPCPSACVRVFVCSARASRRVCDCCWHCAAEACTHVCASSCPSHAAHSHPADHARVMTDVRTTCLIVRLLLLINTNAHMRRRHSKRSLLPRRQRLKSRRSSLECSLLSRCVVTNLLPSVMCACTSAGGHSSQ